MPHSPAVLVTEYRNSLPDNIYRGALAIVDRRGRLVFEHGSADAIVFYRSASKPVQALPSIGAGLDRRYGITERESVIFAGSHAGEQCHIDALESIFKKAGLDEADLVMKPAIPAHATANEARIRANLPPRKLYHNCAGKHASLMLLQRHLGADVRDYWKKGSPADLAVRRTMGIVGEQEITADGVDGCGVPVFAAPVRHIATAYKNLACPELIADDALARAGADFVPRINHNPVMMRGTGYLCGHINEDENIIAKGGAAGVYGLGLKREGLGVAFKLESGSEGGWATVILAVLRGLGALTAHTEAMLEGLGASTLTNDNGEIVGERLAGFNVSI